MTMQTRCSNGFIHRRFNRKKVEVQCHLCGKKLVVFQDENHLDIENEATKKSRPKISRNRRKGNNQREGVRARYVCADGGYRGR